MFKIVILLQEDYQTTKRGSLFDKNDQGCLVWSNMSDITWLD